MKAIDVCCGAGGLSLGLQRAGWEVLGVEKDKDACETHRRYVGPCDHADITEWHPPGPAWLVVGGVPCQSFSVAGERGGLEDARGQLFVHLIRIAVEAEAQIVIMENVEGLLSTEGALPAIYAEMRRNGFTDVRHHVLCAADYGTPQKRYRLFIVGLRAGVTWRWPDPSHGEGPMVPLFGLKPWVTVREALGLGLGEHRKGRIDQAKEKSWFNGGRMLDVDAPSPTVTAHNNPELLDQPACTILTRNDCDPPKGRKSSALLDLRVAVGNALDQPSPTISTGGGGGGKGGAEPIANQKLRKKLLGQIGQQTLLDRPALTLGAGHDTYPDVGASRALHEALASAGILDRPSTTIAGDSRVWAAGHHANAADAVEGDQPSRNANAVRLTVDQCALLQGFPGGWEWAGTTKESQHAQVGNAVPPQLGEAIGNSAAAANEQAKRRTA